MEWKFIGACCLLMWLGETDSLKPRSNLCRHKRVYTADCTPQMGIPHECSAMIKRNNTDCWNMNFPSWNSQRFSRSHFKLKTYCFNDGYYQRTGLNATISSGSWTEAAFRFKIDGMNFVSCVQFAHNASVDDNFLLFYDCLWHEADLHGKQMKVDYILKDQNRDTTDFGSFHFILPQCHFNEIGENDLNISRHQTFIYVDEEASSFSTIHIQKVPVDYQISSYIVQKCHTCETDSHKEAGCSKMYCTTEEQVKTDIDEEEIVLEVPNNSKENCFYLAVEAVCNNCSSSNWCVGHSVLLMPRKTGVTGFSLIVIPSCFLAVLALSWVHCAKRHRAIDGNAYKRPSVLLVYNPVHDIHVQIIRSIVKLMTHYCGIDVMFADIHITESFEKNPLVWYNNAILKADCIAIVTALSSLNGSNSIYNNIFQVGMRLVEEAIMKNPSGIKIFNITFPYNIKSDAPTITKCWQYFHMMNDFDDMIMYVHENVNCVRCQPSILNVHKRANRWIELESLPDYLELCENIENMKKIHIEEESVCLNTIEDNFPIITTSETQACSLANNIAEDINITHVPKAGSRNYLDHKYESLQELLQRNEYSIVSS